MAKETLRDFSGRILGSIDTKPNGDAIAYDFYGRIVGKYNKIYNKTYDFYGRIIGEGNLLAGLVYNNKH